MTNVSGLLLKQLKLLSITTRTELKLVFFRYFLYPKEAELRRRLSFRISVSVTLGDAVAGRYRPGGVSCTTWRRYVTPIRLRIPAFDMFALCMSRGANKQIQDTTPTINRKSFYLSIDLINCFISWYSNHKKHLSRNPWLSFIYQKSITNIFASSFN